VTERSGLLTDGPSVYQDFLVVFITTGGPRGGPIVVPDYLTGSARLSALGSDGPRLDVDGPYTSSVTDLSSRDDNGGIWHGYEFIGIPYNGWGCEPLFVVDVLGTYILLLFSYDRKLGATNF
jgi:hypothetical protein